VVARHVALQPGAEQEGIVHVERAWAARTPSRALREVSRSLGRGYLRLAHRLWPTHPAVIACQSAAQLSRPVVLGALAAAAGLDAASLVRLVVYDDVQTIAAALLKLEPIDPAIPASWVIQACSAAEEFVPMLAELTSPDAIPATGTPQSEEWAESHFRTTQRLFRA
jgi:urease accessory protein